MGLDKLPFLCYYIGGTSVPVGSAFSQENGGGCFLYHMDKGSVKNIFSSLCARMEGGERMDFVTWSELIYLLIELITLAFVILSYLNSKKR